MRLPRNLTVLSPEEEEAIWNTAIRILKEVGFLAPHDKVKSTLQKYGARIDGDVVRVPIKVTKKALATLKRPESPERDEPLYVCVSPNGSLHVVDAKTRSRRPATVDDVAKIAILANHLEYMPSVSRCFCPMDVPEHVKAVAALAALAKHTKKPIGSAPVVKTDLEFECLERIAAIHRGAPYEAKDRPPCSPTIYLISPLRYDPADLDRMVRVMEAGFQPSVASMPMAMSTAPASLSGLLAQRVAESFSAVVITQAFHEGSSVSLGWGGFVADPRSGAYLTSPEPILMKCAAQQLGRRLNYQTGNNPNTNSYMPDFAMGSVWALHTFLPTLAGCASPSIGYHGIGGGMSLERLYMGHVMISYINRLIQGIELDDMDEIVGLLKGVNFEGRFMEQEHTARHCRKFWVSDLLPSDPWEVWHANGAKDIWDLAHQKVEELLAMPYEKPLSEAQEEEVDEIVAMAAKAQ